MSYDSSSRKIARDLAEYVAKGCLISQNVFEIFHIRRNFEKCLNLLSAFCLAMLQPGQLATAVGST